MEGAREAAPCRDKAPLRTLRGEPPPSSGAAQPCCEPGLMARGPSGSSDLPRRGGNPRPAARRCLPPRQRGGPSDPRRLRGGRPRPPQDRGAASEAALRAPKVPCAPQAAATASTTAGRHRGPPRTARTTPRPATVRGPPCNPKQSRVALRKVPALGPGGAHAPAGWWTTEATYVFHRPARRQGASRLSARAMLRATTLVCPGPSLLADARAAPTTGAAAVPHGPTATPRYREQAWTAPGPNGEPRKQARHPSRSLTEQEQRQDATRASTLAAKAPAVRSTWRSSRGGRPSTSHAAVQRVTRTGNRSRTSQPRGESSESRRR